MQPLLTIKNDSYLATGDFIPDTSNFLYTIKHSITIPYTQPHTGLMIFDLESKTSQIIQEFSNNIVNIKVSPLGTIGLICVRDGENLIINLADLPKTDEKSQEKPCNTIPYAEIVVFSHDGKYCITEDDNILNLYEVNADNFRLIKTYTFIPHDGNDDSDDDSDYVTDIKFTAGSREFTLISNCGRVEVFDLDMNIIHSMQINDGDAVDIDLFDDSFVIYDEDIRKFKLDGVMSYEETKSIKIDSIIDAGSHPVISLVQKKDKPASMLLLGNEDGIFKCNMENFVFDGKCNMENFVFDALNTVKQILPRVFRINYNTGEYYYKPSSIKCSLDGKYLAILYDDGLIQVFLTEEEQFRRESTEFIRGFSYPTSSISKSFGSNILYDQNLTKLIMQYITP